MGWKNCHLHQFIFDKQNLGETTKLGDLIDKPGAKLMYEYDFGDYRQHEILLERVLIADESFKPTCVAGARNCPPENCGGPYGFAELLNAVNDRSHPEHDFYCEWLGKAFDPEHFSVDEINLKLHGGRRSRRTAVRKN